MHIFFIGELNTLQMSAKFLVNHLSVCFLRRYFLVTHFLHATVTPLLVSRILTYGYSAQELHTNIKLTVTTTKKRGAQAPTAHLLAE